MTSRSIVYVEDDENDVFLLHVAFEQAGITQPLRTVRTGQEAVSYFSGTEPYTDRAKYPLPDLILLDLKLPGMSGLEVLEWVRRQPALKTLVVVVLSSSSRLEDVAKAYELGANSYVLKPVDVPERLHLVKELQAWWLQLNQFAPARTPGGE